MLYFLTIKNYSTSYLYVVGALLSPCEPRARQGSTLSLSTTLQPGQCREANSVFTGGLMEMARVTQRADVIFSLRPNHGYQQT